MGQVLWFVTAKEPEGKQKSINSTESPLVFLGQPVLYAPAVCPGIKELMKSAPDSSSAGVLLSCLCTFFRLGLTCWHPERLAFQTDGRWVIWGDTLSNSLERKQDKPHDASVVNEGAGNEDFEEGEGVGRCKQIPSESSELTVQKTWTVSWPSVLQKRWP